MAHITNEHPRLKDLQKCLHSAPSLPNVKTRERDPPLFSQTCLLIMCAKLAKCKGSPDRLRFASEVDDAERPVKWCLVRAMAGLGKHPAVMSSLLRMCTAERRIFALRRTAKGGSAFWLAERTSHGLFRRSCFDCPVYLPG